MASNEEGLSLIGYASVVTGNISSNIAIYQDQDAFVAMLSDIDRAFLMDLEVFPAQRLFQLKPPYRMPDMGDLFPTEQVVANSKFSETNEGFLRKSKPEPSAELDLHAAHYRVSDIRDFEADQENNYSTAEIAANSPRYRRRSSTFIDGVHDLPDEKSSPMAPAQLYSTMSGRLFHSGRIVIVLVGPPARGKTYVEPQ